MEVIVPCVYSRRWGAVTLVFFDSFLSETEIRLGAYPLTVIVEGGKNRSRMPQGYPSFSVIIPAYDAEATLLSTLASVEKSFAAIKARHPGVQGEAIIVNDGSTDRTRALA